MATALTKGEIVLFALRKFAIASSATLTDVEPESIEDAVNDLEDMMYEWMITPGDIGYSFSADNEDPLPDDDAGIPRAYKMGVGYQLALRMMSDYEIEPSARFETNAQKSYDAILIDTLIVPSISRRADQPLGQGNKPERYLDGDRFYQDPETE
ncbi:packaged DNA stabilization gp4 family protein [Vibrio diazotrophicus]|uniref:packaged DNA stabilization gp4 family protein n=1 Tax=Vibrio diazotrophicus TaxID=685 RepID=UPI000C9DCAD7|nr:packaged DNA stabilization gp4 family protein [Vibrio diazotrophicus]PNH94088.1 packaged DNA stabilization protein p27 [Vibrio diazotrophicus]